MKIFLSYRRDDTDSQTERIYEFLSTKEGRANIFKDTKTINPGDDFRNALRKSIHNADVILVIIGPRWLEISDETGGRRIDNPNDYLRLEIALAFELGKLLIPVLVDNARIPTPNQLPEQIRELSFVNAVMIGNGLLDYELESLHTRLHTTQGHRKGFCYLNREGIDKLCMMYNISFDFEPFYSKRIQSLITYLDTQNLLSMEANPSTPRFALITSHFKFIEDDNIYLSFRAEPYGFRLNMSKEKSTIWPYKTKMPPLTHVRVALMAGVQFWVFGEWFSVDYLRPHAISIIGYNLGSGCNSLF